MENLIKILTDPISNRIIQQIRKNQKMTVSEILAVTPDIPRATVYRRIERMTSAGVIEIVETHKVRGQAEHTYSVKNIYITAKDSGENGMEIMTASFVQMFHLCSEYFKSENADVERDKLFILNYAIRLSDHDFSEMLKEILAVVDRYQGKNIPKDANTRNLYLMSLPAGGDTNEP
ncbi:MAG: helix-turn-helix domain-containing protein [Ruminococcus sp.]|jgi:predicted transcriptional regulator|uniref:helix-turn-helix domain-containing protein n=1 Tax=Ruminococcus sp. TaxID=41978 RepID=UPI0025D7429A|nr:helix-turn-helix domain-containing protein [Ruminococcus sp.]MBR6996683.1 helix-turn-helix domain-containing protein [Ruminococcus sp.]